ncbi:hypothetical protein FBEOM_2965 [Fusarium beomiforme]|uniref:Uncharacterized protein n=1 Tax=Fusarium beomiforme TaxID=44412 RepID=A0A9P5DZM4_9HYPO|nr:hypothetical protein FBEOM_2965 [Fusarium beomiforme]
MSQCREIKVIMSSNPCTTRIAVTKINKKAASYDCLFGPLKSWTRTIFGKKPAYVELDEDFEPLLDEKMAPRPIYAASKIMRMATPRTIKRYNRLP